MSDPTTAILILFSIIIFTSVALIGRFVYNRLEQYHYFSHYLGPNAAQQILASKHSARLYKLLKLYTVSGSGEVIFDTALRIHSYRSNDEEEYELLRGMLNYYDSKLFSTTKIPIKYNERDFHTYWYQQTKYTSRHEIYRLMLWLLLMNPIGIYQLDDM